MGIKKGFIVGVGKAGNPDVMDGVTEGLVVGVNTEVIAGEKLILTAGAIDAHVHYICPQLWTEVSLSPCGHSLCHTYASEPGFDRLWRRG